MKAVTLRNLPPELERTIRQRARDRGWSLNRAVTSVLEESLGVQDRTRRARYHDLDELAGSWTKREADEFDRHLAAQRTIDPDAWR